MIDTHMTTLVFYALFSYMLFLVLYILMLKKKQS